MKNIYLKYLTIILQALGFIFVVSIDSSHCSNAQILPDRTLGKQSSRLRGHLILGGKRAGRNLFHSFREFSIPAESSAYFDTPKGVVNIIGRVSGNKTSNIEGILGVRGNANLIFLNKNAITFGEKATLDVNGDFLASTADRIVFDQGFVSANNSIQDNLLRTDPVALAFDRNLNAPINIQTKASAGSRENYDVSQKMPVQDLTGLRVNNGKSLLLVGGDVTLRNSGLNALSGNVEIGSLARGGRVDLKLNGKGNKLLFPERFKGGTVHLDTGSKIDVSGETLGSQAGTVQIVAKDIRLSGSEILSEANSDQDGGNLTFRALGDVQMFGEMSEMSRLSTLTAGEGQGSTISIDANQFIANNDSFLVAGSFGTGQGGEILINAKELFEITGADRKGIVSGLISIATAQGNGGDIEINVPILKITENSVILGSNINILAHHIIIRENAGIVAASSGSGAVSNIRISADNLSLDSAFIQASSSKITVDDTSSANILLNISDSIELDNSNNNNISIFTPDSLSITPDSLSMTPDSLFRLIPTSLISSLAIGQLIGANILIINSPVIVLKFGESDILAKAPFGNGGNIISDSKLVDVFIARQDSDTESLITDNKNSISATGIISDVFDNIRGIKPSEVSINPESLITQNPCSKGRDSTFSLSGKGGLPRSINPSLSSTQSYVDIIEPTINSEQKNNSGRLLIPNENIKGKLDTNSQAAQGWIYDNLGTIQLVADSNQTIPQITRKNKLSSCSS